MTLRIKSLIVLLISVAVIAGVYLWASKQRAKNLAQGRVDSPVANTGPGKVIELRPPVILLLLDTSASLPRGRTRPGNDPENREFEATELLLRLVHHFSSAHEGGFAPQLGIVTFGASPRWLTVDGQRLWQLRSPESLARTLGELERLMGGIGEDDRRRGTYTDFNGALVEAIGVLNELPAGVSPLVLMMTDGEHHPYPAHPWNYGPHPPLDLEQLHKELRFETLRSLEQVKSVVPQPLYDMIVERMKTLDYGQHEPVEYVWGLPTHDSEIAAHLERNDNRAAFSYVIAAVRDVRLARDHFARARRAADKQLLEAYLPKLAKRADVQLVGLSPYRLQELENRDEKDPNRRMVDDLRRMVAATESDPSQLRWCDDRGLAGEFLSIFEGWLQLLRQEAALETSPVIEVGGHVEGLAVLVELDDGRDTPLTLIGPGVKIVPLSSRSGRHLFLVDRPVPGTYRVRAESSALKGSLLGLVQTDPLFQVVGVAQRASVATGAPAARIAAFAAETGQRVALHEVFEQVGDELVGELVTAGQQVQKVRWTVLRDEHGRPDDFELQTDFWASELARRPGRYTVHTTLRGLKYKDGSPVTPQPLDFEFVVEPAVLITVHDAEGYHHGSLDFPLRNLPLRREQAER